MPRVSFSSLEPIWLLTTIGKLMCGVQSDFHPNIMHDTPIVMCAAATELVNLCRVQLRSGRTRFAMLRTLVDAMSALDMSLASNNSNAVFAACGAFAGALLTGAKKFVCTSSVTTAKLNLALSNLCVHAVYLQSVIYFLLTSLSNTKCVHNWLRKACCAACDLCSRRVMFACPHCCILLRAAC